MKLDQVIVVDDNESTRLHVRILMEREGFAQSVLTFGTAIEALAFLQRPEGHDVDAILLAIDLPAGGCQEFLVAYSHLHARQRAHAVVVMRASSRDARDLRHQPGCGSVTRYIAKPVDAGQLRELVIGIR